MENITLKILDLARLSTIQANLERDNKISISDAQFLANFLKQLPSQKEMLAYKIPLDLPPIPVKVWDVSKIDGMLGKWLKLFDNIPGYNYVGCHSLEYIDPDLIKTGVILEVVFAPTLAYNNLDGLAEPFLIHIKDNGSAVFILPTVEDAMEYPELYAFKGTWKEAYRLLMETLKKGWPMEEFPKELKQFFKK